MVTHQNRQPSMTGEDIVGRFRWISACMWRLKGICVGEMPEREVNRVTEKLHQQCHEKWFLILTVEMRMWTKKDMHRARTKSKCMRNKSIGLSRRIVGGTDGVITVNSDVFSQFAFALICIRHDHHLIMSLTCEANRNEECGQRKLHWQQRQIGVFREIQTERNRHRGSLWCYTFACECLVRQGPDTCAMFIGALHVCAFCRWMCAKLIGQKFACMVYIVKLDRLECIINLNLFQPYVYTVFNWLATTNKTESLVSSFAQWIYLLYISGWWAFLQHTSYRSAWGRQSHLDTN